jgi:y4mF family transcriptional regulator
MQNTNKELAQKLGKAIRRSRKSLKLSQSTLAQLAGVSLNYISQLEQGKPKAQLDTLLNVLEVLGLELNLVTGKTKLKIATDLDLE